MDGSRRSANRVVRVTGTRLGRLGRRRLLVVATVVLAAMAFVLLTGSALAARPSPVDGPPVADGPQFTIEKLQRIAGTEGDFTTDELTAEVGQSVEYEIVVTDTGDSSLSFSELQDEDCQGISPAGETELQPGEHETFRCEELLMEPGPWTNQAEIEAGGESQLSNTVVVEVTEPEEAPEEEPEAPEFRVEKLQRLKGGGGGFSTDFLTGTAGQTVEYEIVVENTGNTSLSFPSLEDANCTNISPSGQTELAAGDSETFTCEHTLAEPGEFWINEVTLTSGELQRRSNPVYAEAVEEPEFTIEKLQKVEGSETSFTSGELTAKLGQSIEYEIVVSNTGSRSLTFEPLSDPNCTGIVPAEATQLEPGASETFTCRHALTSAGGWSNIAEIEAEFRRGTMPETAHARVLPGGEGVIKKASSNEVVTNVPAEPDPEVETPPSPAGSNTPSNVSEQPAQQVQAKCTVSESSVALAGASGSKRAPFTVRVPALGIKQITFYLDGHRLETLTAVHADKGEFSVRIDPSRLRYGAHRVSVKTVMSETACAAIARAAVFVHARPAAVKPKFTG